MFNVIVDYLPEDDEVAVVQQTTSRRTEPIEPLFDGRDVLQFHEVVRKVPIAEDLVRYAVKLSSASRPGPAAPDFITQWVSWGAGLRAAQSLVLGAKTRALPRAIPRRARRYSRSGRIPHCGIAFCSVIGPRPTACLSTP